MTADPQTATPDAIQTERLDLRRPVPGDLDELFAIESDPRVWTHYPSLRVADPADTHASIERRIRGWDTDGLSMWTVRRRDEPGVIGYGGCTARGAGIWNLGYRLSADVHGRGYATELARAAVRQARAVEPDRAIIAFLVEHNHASARVAVKLGMQLVFRGPDTGNPDPGVVRLIYSDRPLSAAQLASLRG